MRKDIEFDQFRKMLEAQQTITQQQLDQEMNSLQTYPDANPDFLDAATKSIDHGQRIERISYLKARQNQIGEAIRRLEAGKFGICSNCGKDIGVDRLKIKPYARYCIKCKEKAEQKKR